MFFLVLKKIMDLRRSSKKSLKSIWQRIAIFHIFFTLKIYDKYPLALLSLNFHNIKTAWRSTSRDKKNKSDYLK
jgi:hypothetical protein